MQLSEETIDYLNRMKEANALSKDPIPEKVAADLPWLPRIQEHFADIESGKILDKKILEEKKHAPTLRKKGTKYDELRAAEASTMRGFRNEINKTAVILIDTGQQGLLTDIKNILESQRAAALLKLASNEGYAPSFSGSLSARIAYAANVPGNGEIALVKTGGARNY